jgi:hypothetical protein
MPAVYREPLCLSRVLPPIVYCPAAHQRELPLLHSSYGLMSQTKILLPPSVSLVRRSVQVVVGPCWKLALPGVISIILVWVLGPVPRSVSPVHIPVSSRKVSASLSVGGVRHTNYSP